MAHGELIVHNAGASFVVPAIHAQAAKLTPMEIAAIIRRGSSDRKR
jgi:hypothetical protein